jgi:elongator complex protein 3
MFNQMHIFFNPPVHSYKYIIGFCRLRINKNISYKIFPVLRYAAIVRELHVYSNTIAKGSTKSSLQHTGYGTQLMLEAEKISLLHKYNKIAVIAGVGARDFYKNKLNYVLQDDYMIKEKITGIAAAII